MLNVLLIGLGNIGLNYDLNSSNSFFLSHSKAFSGHPKTKLVAAIDPSENQRNKFEEKYSTPAFLDFESFYSKFTETKIDIVVIATPPVLRIDIVKEALILFPKLFLIEKPLAMTTTEAQEIVTLLKMNDIDIFVNYIRRCDPSTETIKEIIRKQELGKLLSVQGIYNKGLFNTASHFIDLLNYLLGTPTCYSPLSDQISKNEPLQFDFSIAYNRVNCIFQSINTNSYDIGEINFFFEKGVLRSNQQTDSIRVHKLKEEKAASGRKSLDPQGDEIKNEYYKYQINVVNDIVAFYEDGSSLKSTGDSALQSLEICEQLSEMSFKNKGKI